MEKIPNYIAGAFSTDGDSKTLLDVDGHESAMIFDCPNSELRRAKRNLLESLRQLKRIPPSAIVKLVKRIPDFYYTDTSRLEQIANLTGSPKPFLQRTIQEGKYWCSHIESFVEYALDNHRKTQIVQNVFGRRQFEAVGPVIAVLPQNSDEEALLVIVQALLARAPILLRCSSEGGSSFSAIEVVKALGRCIDEENDPLLEPLRKAISIVNVFGSGDKETILDKLHVNNSCYIIFGRQDTIKKARSFLLSRGECKVIGMGAGLASAFILDDSDTRLAADEIFQGTIFNNGNECISTAIAYIHCNAYQDIIDQLRFKCEEISSESYDREISELGVLRPRQAKETRNYLVSRGIEWQPDPQTGRCKPCVIEVAENSPVAEVPGPLIFVRRINSIDQALKIMESDLEANELSRNICTSVFTKNKDTFEDIARSLSSHLVRWNRGTHRINLFSEHQGMCLLREFVSPKLIED